MPLTLAATAIAIVVAAGSSLVPAWLDGDWFTERGVRITGTDAWSWDAPFVHTARRFAETHDSSIVWEGHRAGMERAYCHIEKLANLESLPPTGFMISYFTFKILKASAGFTRAVAIFED